MTLSAFGYGADCDQVLLSTLADVGGGSFASIDGDDAVLTAFARELGGLVATYAADVRVRFVPLAGAPFEDRLGDLLFGGMASTGARIAVPARGNGVAIEAGEVEVRWRDALGREQREVTPLRVDYVDASEADLAELAEVVRARDERLLRIAQERAEAAAFRGDFPSAARAINEVLKSCRLMPRQLLTVEGSKPPPAPLRRVNRRIHPTRSRAQDVAAD